MDRPAAQPQDPEDQGLGEGAICLAVRVPRAQGEATRQRLRDLGVLRLDLRPRAEGAALLLPVTEAARDALLGFPFTTDRFAPQAPPPPRYQDLAHVPEALRGLLPTGFDAIGHAIVVKLPPELEPHAAAVGEALLAAHRSMRTVLLDRGVQGRERIRQVEVIAGDPDTVVEHVEHGVRLRADLAAAYFSPRLATEHDRVAGLVRPDEVVLDLFAGVGPFAIHAAKRGRARRVYAVDVNPGAVQAIEANARLNKVQDRVVPVLDDAASFAPRVAGQCDRVIMNLPHGADAFWEAALGACKPAATVHYHRILDRGAEQAHAALLVERAARAGWTARLAAARVVRAYSPGSDHLAMDFEVRLAAR